MKKNVSILFIMACMCLVLGCSKDDKGEAMIKNVPVTQEQLLQKVFVIETVNGKSIETKERVPELNFLEDSRLAGLVCNHFNGQYQLENSVLKSERMMSTKMLCGSAELNTLENMFFSMLTNGMKASLNNDKLTLVEGENTLVYTLKKEEK